MSSHAELPRSLAWLKDAVVEMLIDQEGFRSITPSFRFAGYSTNTRSLDPSDKGIEGGAVQFIPVTRQTFNFHYAPFDGQPVLRRISVNGASRDHVSRQATISLKSNGVYEVRGIETSLLPSKGDGIEFSAEPPKLRWKLDYYVDDRRDSGRCEGEKTFTPLTFSCSPLLLHPLQGRKIKLMHVMRKNVVTKLVAEKMQLPKTTTSRSPSPVLREDFSSPTSVRIDPTKVQLWNLHRRFLSHGQSNTHARPQSNENRMSDYLGTIQVEKAHFHYQQQIVFQQHQRASSAEEVAVVDLRLGCQDAAETDEVKIDGIRYPMTDLSPNRGPPTVSHDRHILPPSKLSELLEIKTIRPQEQNIEQLFGGLTPAPRNLKSFGSK